MKALCFSLILTCLPASAVSFVTVQCSLQSGVPIAYSETPTASSCSGGSDQYGRVNAVGEVSLDLSADPSQFSTLSVYSYSLIRQGYPTRVPEDLWGPGGLANIAIDYQTQVLGAGPIRSGYVQVDFNYVSENPYDGSASLTAGLTLNAVSTSFANPVTLISCASTGYCNVGPSYYPLHASLIPVTLGVPIGLEAVGTLQNASGYIDGQSGGRLGITYQFRFLEADGVTPVGTSEVPEPATWGLVSASVVLAGLVRRVGRLSR
jgi:hypothetical protein